MSKHKCDNINCTRCMKQHNNGGDSYMYYVAIFLLVLIVIMLTSCDKPRTVITTRDYKVDVITVDSVQYLVIPGTGIIKHEPR